MFVSWIDLFIALLICVCVSLLVMSGYRHRHKLMPGPTGFPFIGLLTKVGDGDVHKTLTSLGTGYGRMFQFRILGRTAVVLRSASAVEKLLNGTYVTGRSPPFLQKYILNNKGFAFEDYTERVPELRTVFYTALYNEWKTREDTCDFLSSKMDILFSELISKADQNVSPDPYFRKLLGNMYIHLLTGDTIPEDDPDRQALWDLIHHLYSLLEPSIDTPLRYVPFLRHLPGKYGNTFRSAIKARDRVTKRFFEPQKATFREGHTRGLIDVCLQLQADDRKRTGRSWLTDDYVQGLMFDTLSAGMSEMLKTFRLIILLMCHHQDVQSRVHIEIDDVIGLDSRPSSSHRDAMPFTQAVIYEMLRYVSQTPLAIPHKCNKDVVLDGYLIKKDSGILPNIWGIHHDEEVWGDPWTFRPERFLDNNGHLLADDHKLMKSLIPFSVGKRRCPGEKFAMSRTFLFLTSLLQRLHFVPPLDEELPSADPRLYTNQYPLNLPVYKCRALQRDHESTSS